MHTLDAWVKITGLCVFKYMRKSRAALRTHRTLAAISEQKQSSVWPQASEQLWEERNFASCVCVCHCVSSRIHHTPASPTTPRVIIICMCTLGPSGFVADTEWKIPADSSSCFWTFSACVRQLEFCSCMCTNSCSNGYFLFDCWQVGKMQQRNCRFDSNFFKSIWPKVNSLHGVMPIIRQRMCTWKLAQNIQISWEIADQSSMLEMIDLHEKVCRKN